MDCRLLTLAFDYDSFLFLSTVKVVLFPVGQEIIMPFKIDTIVKYLKDHFSYQLLIPSNILQIRYAGKFGS